MASDSQSSPLLSAANQSVTDYDSISSVESNHDRTESKPLPTDLESDVLPETSTLGRTLTWRSAYIITISRVLGSGIFATPGVILAAVGSPGLAFTLWIAGAILAYFGLTISLEYGCMLPRSGGSKTYLEFTYRHPKYLSSILIATHAIFLGFTASNCIVFAQYVLFAGGIEGSEVLRKGIAVGLLTIITAVHAIWRGAGVKIQDFLGFIKIGMIVFMILSGVFVVLFRREERDVEQTRPFSLPPSQELTWTWTGFWAGSIWSFGAIATSILKVFYSFAGLSNVNNVLNEVKDPVRTLKSVTLASLATASAMYALANVAYLLVVPIDDVKSSGELIAALFFQRVFGDTVGRRILPIMVALSAAGNVMVVTFALARLNQEIARSGLIPFSALLSSTKPFNSPLGGLLVHYVPSLLVLTVPSGDVYSFILEVEGYAGQFISIAVAIGLIYLRFKRQDLYRPYRAWIPGVCVSLAVSAALLLAPFFPSKAQREKGMLGGIAYALVGIVVFAFGGVYWFVWARVLPKRGGYRLVDRTQVLGDGTSVVMVERVKEEQVER